MFWGALAVADYLDQYIEYSAKSLNKPKRSLKSSLDSSVDANLIGKTELILRS